MTASTSADAKKTKMEKRSPSEELQHISELLEEVVSLIKGNAQSNKKSVLERPSSSTSEVMTVKEAAAMLRISLPMMYEFAKSGKVRTLEVGRRILISRSSLMALLQEGENNGN